MTGDTRISYTVDQSAQATGVHADTIREAVYTGRLAAKRVGRRILIGHDALREWLDGLDDYEPPTGGR